jgi:hypothetical protein
MLSTFGSEAFDPDVDTRCQDDSTMVVRSSDCLKAGVRHYYVTRRLGLSHVAVLGPAQAISPLTDLSIRYNVVMLMLIECCGQQYCDA